MSTNQMVALMGEMAVFVKVVETGSFSETARQLGATPSAISRSVARLEKALGTRLLQRTTRKLRLSEGGHEVHARCLEFFIRRTGICPRSSVLSSTSWQNA